jgi:hypothetical protein
MSVYVDPLFSTTPSAKWPHRRACHMFADSPEELHELAGLIGLSRSWCQDSPGFTHYDLAPHKRGQAIARGAVHVDRKYAVEFRKRKLVEEGIDHNVPLREIEDFLDWEENQTVAGGG